MFNAVKFPTLAARTWGTRAKEMAASENACGHIVFSGFLFLGCPGVLQQVIGEIVFYLRFIADHFVIRGAKQLLATITQLLADGGLHTRIGEFSLSGRFAGDELQYLRRITVRNAFRSLFERS